MALESPTRPTLTSARRQDMMSTRSFALTIGIGLLAPAVLKAEVTTWQLGGSQPWADQDTVSIMIDFERVPGAIQPVRVEPGVNIISLLDNWTTFRQPKELGYIDGERPRIWKWNEGNGDPTENGVALIDADSSTYNSSKAEGIGKQFFTIDLAVPVPAHTFGRLPLRRHTAAHGLDAGLPNLDPRGKQRDFRHQRPTAPRKDRRRADAKFCA